MFTPVHHHPSSSSSSFNLLFIYSQEKCLLYHLPLGSYFQNSHTHPKTLSLSTLTFTLPSLPGLLVPNFFCECFHRNPVVIPSLLLLYCNMYMDVFFFLFHALQQLFLFEKTHTVSYTPFMSSPCIFDFTFFGLPFSFSFLSFGDRFGYKFRRKASVFFTSRQSKS